MSPELRSETLLVERNALRWLLLFYCLFIVYGTFIPFRFTSNSIFVHSQWRHFFGSLFADAKQFSTMDVISNVLLFLPFGFLWAGSEIGKPFICRFPGTMLATAGLGLLFGTGIEVGQTFSPGRTAALLDVLCNCLGAGLGGAFGYFIFPAVRGRLGSAMKKVIRERPLLILWVLLMAMAAADAYYPFQITMDVSTVWQNFKHIQWLPFIGGTHRFWMDLVVEKVFLFSAISYLAARNLGSRGLAAGALALGLCVAVAFALEAAKLLFVGRVPNPENFILYSVGAILGPIILDPLSKARFFRYHSTPILIALALGIQAYSELSPFDWVMSTDHVAARVDRIEWLPFIAYYNADPQLALFDVAKKVLITAPLGFLLAARTQRSGWFAMVLGLVLGALLELCQITLWSRSPSLTDVLLFGIAAWLGAMFYEHFSEFRNPQAPELSEVGFVS